MSSAMDKIKMLIKMPIGTKLWTEKYGYCSLSEVTDTMIYMWPCELEEDEHIDTNIIAVPIAEIVNDFRIIKDKNDVVIKCLN